MEQKDIKIFLASSNELNDDRVWFGDFVQGINKIYQERGKGVDVCKWEFFDAANNDVRKQEEYNERIRESNMFLALFHKKAGKYTLEEYNVAMEAYRKSHDGERTRWTNTLFSGMPTYQMAPSYPSTDKLTKVENIYKLWRLSR